MHTLLYNTQKLSKVDLSDFDASLIADFSFMFANSNIKEMDDLNIITNNAKNFSYMFSNKLFYLK